MYKINPEKCVSCGACTHGCPMQAIVAAGGKYEIKPELCAKCGLCVSLCPLGAIAKEEKKEVASIK